MLYGERRQVVKAVDCGSTIRGFDSRRSPSHRWLTYSQYRSQWGVTRKCFLNRAILMAKLDITFVPHLRDQL